MLINILKDYLIFILMKNIFFQGSISKVYIRHFAWANGRVVAAGVQGGRERVERRHPAREFAPPRDRYVIWAGRHGDRGLAGRRRASVWCTGRRETRGPK